MVAMASASNATKVTASTRPTVSGRRSGAHIPPAGPAGVVEALAASVLTKARVKPQPRLKSSGVAGNEVCLAESKVLCPIRAGGPYPQAGSISSDEEDGPVDGCGSARTGRYWADVTAGDLPGADRAIRGGRGGDHRRCGGTRRAGTIRARLGRCRDRQNAAGERGVRAGPAGRHAGRRRRLRADG